MAEETPGFEFPLEALARRVQSAAGRTPWVRPVGEVRAVTPSAVVVSGLSRHLRLGSLVEIPGDAGPVIAEVVRLDEQRAAVKALRNDAVVTLGNAVYPAGTMSLFPHASWKGRVINSLGEPADGAGMLLQGRAAAPLHGSAPAAMSRALVGKPFATGVRVVDAFTPLCHGQRIGIFAGSGVGKSTLLSMLSQASGCDCVVAALVGERGREVREFVESALGPAVARTIVVVSTGDESAMMRRMAPLSAMAIAEHFRDFGEQVLLIMDSVTRYAHACREVALAAGEPPVARGFPPSVFGDLPRLLERAGPGLRGGGTITGIFTVLVDGDDHNDPVADAIRGTLDGHIVLDREIAERGRYPAVNILSSISRLADRSWSPEQRAMISETKRLVSRFEETRDLRAMGGYVAGGDAELDRAVAMVPVLYRILGQRPENPSSQDAFREITEALSCNSA